jgi:hypothetical protein
MVEQVDAEPYRVPFVCRLGQAMGLGRAATRMRRLTGYERVVGKRKIFQQSSPLCHALARQLHVS